MTERLGNGDRQRGVARLTLALVLAIVLLVGVSFSTSVRDASAQPPGTSPTGTETTTGDGSPSPAPATPTGTKIQFLNPSKYPEGPEFISNKNDADDLYHLVAWVSAPPAGAHVVFEIEEAGEAPRTIGPANRVGGAGSDTFELFWDLRTQDDQEVENGEYTLRALLFSSAQSPGSPIASDEEEVEVDRTRETVEIIDPPNPGSLGVYDPDASGSGRRPGFTVLVRTSGDTDGVRIEYSESVPGSEPAWSECEDQETVHYTDRFKRIGCTIDPAETQPRDITAIAAVATEDVPASGVTGPGTQCISPACTPASERDESGDAHRISDPYRADPDALSLTTHSTNATRNTCHELTATVLDQFNRVIWRANVDVHATGPSDALRFAETERTSDFQAANMGGHNDTEPAWDCEDDDDSTRQQAEHTRSDDDQKHIESLPNQGSSVAGEFIFALRSPDLEDTPSRTVVEAWADEDDDDVNDAQNQQGQTDATVDPSATTTLTWTAPSPGSPTFPSGSSPSGTSPSGTSPSGTSPSATVTSPSASPDPMILNCEPETRTNATNTPHTITCTVTRAGSPISGVPVDIELSRENDVDGTDSPNTPDRECTTQAPSGSCTFTHGPGGFGSTTEPGTTVYRAWIDADDNDGTPPEADQAEGVNESQQPGPVEPDGTDVVEKTWQRAPLDCFPEQDSNPVGTSHTVTCRASQTGGAPQPQGTHIVAEATGANDPDGTESLATPDFECRTNQDGVCSFTHGPGPDGRGTTNLEGLTRYRVWIDPDNSNSTEEADRAEGRDESSTPGATEPDQTDVVDKTWTRNPTAVTIDPESDSASVGTCNAFTITVLGDNQPVGGVFVDVEQRHERADNQTQNDEPRVAFCTPPPADGPNPSAVDQTQGDLDPPDETPDNAGTLGGETLTATDLQGRVTIGITVQPANGSDGTGNVRVTAFFETDDDDDPEAGEPQDASTKTWIVPEARTITCLPDTATNPVNTQHTVTCTVRDRFGAPVAGEAVTFTEEGPGDFTSRGTSTDANGQVRAVTTSSQAGTQTITATIGDDLQGAEPGEVDECDRAAGDPAGAPAGACADSVTKTWGPVTTSPAQAERDVTIEAQKAEVLYNKNVTLSGTVEADGGAPAACTQFVEVNILRDVVGGADEFELFATEQTDADGAYSHSFRADRSANYVAEVDETAGCGAATSDAEPVLVKVKVSLRLSDSNVRKGQRVRLTVRTAPCPETARDRVLLFRAIDGQFGKVGGKRTNENCTKSFRRRVREDSVFQARWPKQAPEFLAGESRAKIVRVR